MIEAAIAKRRLSYGVIRRAARVVPMSTDHALWPRPLTGTTVYPLSEVPTDITESEATAASFSLRVVDWGTKFRWSKNLEEDAVISIADMLVNDFAYRLSKNEDTVCFNGTGIASSHGVWGIMAKLQDATYANSVYTTISGNTTWSELDMDDFTRMVGMLPEFAESSAAWYISKPAFYASMAKLAYAAGGNTKDDTAGGLAQQFLGIPVVFTNVLNTTLTTQAGAYGCLLGDISMAATFGDRRGMTAETNPYKYMEQRQMLLVATQRWGFAAHDLLDEDGGAGPVIALKFNS
jgi:HK97 family phage major capsid protein